MGMLGVQLEVELLGLLGVVVLQTQVTFFVPWKSPVMWHFFQAVGCASTCSLLVILWSLSSFVSSQCIVRGGGADAAPRGEGVRRALCQALLKIFREGGGSYWYALDELQWKLTCNCFK